ncbi:MAG: YbaY family lipoprotein [Pirellulaceae bacterium]|nr:YbaY family lipoprotein [Pirellulaceae bacterium]
MWRSSFRVAAIWSAMCGLVCVSALPVQAQRFTGPINNSSDLYNNLPAWQGGNWLGTSLVPTQDWKLGVQTDDLEIGVLVRQVAPGSAAERANLEVNDLIVAVGGQQVGIVDGRFVDFSAEIRRRADQSGNVSLLVQDTRSGRLASIRVRLDGNQSALRGTVVRRDRAFLPADARVTVSVQNISRPIYVVRNGEATYSASGQNSIPFEINYDPSYIDPNDAYQVQAQIVSNGRIIYHTLQPVRVLGSSRSDGIQIEVVPIQNTTVASIGSPVISAGYGSVNDSLVAQYSQIYRRYLGRNPYDVELAAFMVSPNAASELQTLPLNLMASQQYYDAVGNNNTMWITAVFQQIIGRAPSLQERDQWLKFFNDLRGSRMEVLRQLANSKRV